MTSQRRIRHWCEVLLLGSVLMGVQTQAADLRLPYAQAGLTELQAAAVLLDRFTYGAQPGEAEQVARLGLVRWFEQQLAASTDEAPLNMRLSGVPALRMTHQELFGKYPSGGQSTAHARRFYDLVPPADAAVDMAWSARKLKEFHQQQGYLSQEGELYQQLVAQKLIRTVYTRNQLQEVLTEFWHNHFYVSSSNFRSRPWVLAYEAEAIRPHALGKFRALLEAVTKHPAYLQATLGDAQKATLKPEHTTMGMAFARLAQQGQHATIKDIELQLDKIASEEDLLLQKRFWPETGNNLEFARVLLQQTVGADHYRDSDLAGTARVFTGWTTLPYGVNEQWFTGGFVIGKPAGFVQQGSFVFRADRHDALPKQVRGQHFAAGGGVAEGEQLLDKLAVDDATAKQIASRLACQFVGEHSDAAVVARLAATFKQSRGDVPAMLRTLVASREFWRAAALRQQEKSPLQYAASALRAVRAELTDTNAVSQWITSMGQPLYAYADSQGVPQNRNWLGGAQLVARINFAMALSNNQIDGVTVVTTDQQALAMQLAAPAFQMR